MVKDCLTYLDDSYEIRPRVKNLREKFFSYKPSICSERAKLVTMSYKETEGQPYIIRRAKALEKVLDQMSIYIQDGELIVGNLASKPRSAPVFPEFSVNWIEEELKGNPVHFTERPGDPFEVDPAVEKELMEDVFPYWKGKTHEDRVHFLLPKETWEAGQEVKAFDVSWLMNSGDGHTIPDYKKVIQKGLTGIIKEAEERLASLDLTDPEDLKKRTFLEAVIIVNRAAIRFAQRYAEQAQRLADEEKDPKRKEELIKISNVCKRVPAYPATSFHEALQSALFINLVIQLENNGHSISFGRVDQYMYPYYKKDIDEGNITNEDALELLNCMWIKLNELSKLRDWHNTKFFIGNPLFQNLTIGGQTLSGKDAVNELSYLCLASTKKLRMTQPSLTVRYFNGTSRVFLMECAKVIRMGTGMPALFNDEAIIPALINIGYSYEDACDYGITGCVEPSPQGKIGGRFGASFPNHTKVLELTLNDGKDPRTGLQLCKGNGNLTDFKTFDDFVEAFKKQLNFYLKHHIIADNIIDLSWEELIPNPFLSSVIEDCIARGKEIKQGGAKYDYTGGQSVGIISCANAIATLKKVVFDEGLITLEQLKHALDTNFEDNTTNPTGEEIRQLLLTKGPKVGNDDDYVDSIAADFIRYWATQKMKYKNTRHGKGPIGGFFIPSTATVSANVPSGEVIGATPDGRKAGEPVSEGISVYRGTDKNGPTALINSIGKIPNYLMVGGQLLNIKLNPMTIDGEKGLKNLVALIKTLFDKKGFHVQFNVISAQTLEDARKHPEKYQDLIVRVAGYSAYFVTLDPEIQKDIIARTEHMMA
ncbi:MAG TPA: glycyl radical protein [Clostridiales bacterium]|nr:glycyl radical protein [Clostridiales bacterium]